MKFLSYLLPAETFPELRAPLTEAEVRSALNRLGSQDPTLRAMIALLHTHWQAATIESHSLAPSVNRDYWAGAAAALSRVLDHLAVLRATKRKP